MAMTSAQVDDVIEKVSSMVGGDDRGIFAFVLRMAADTAENTDQFAMLAMRMMEQTYGKAA